MVGLDQHPLGRKEVEKSVIPEITNQTSLVAYQTIIKNNKTEVEFSHFVEACFKDSSLFTLQSMGSFTWCLGTKIHSGAVFSQPDSMAGCLGRLV